MAKPTLLADLTVRKGTPNASVKILGTTTEGDAPERHFIWNDESLLTADGVQIIAVTGVAIGRWIQIPSGGTPKVTYHDFEAGEDTINVSEDDVTVSILGLNPVEAFLDIYDPTFNSGQGGYGNLTPSIIDAGTPKEGQVLVDSVNSLITLPGQSDEEIANGNTRRLKLVSYTVAGNPQSSDVLALIGQKASITYVNSEIAKQVPVSSANVATALVSGDVMYNIRCQYTNEIFTAEKVTLNQYGEPIDVSDVDNVVYFKKGSLYYKRVFHSIKPEYWGAVGLLGSDDTDPIESASLYVNSIGRGELCFDAKNYYVSSFTLRKGVNIKGSKSQVAATATKNETCTTIYALDNADVLCSLEYDGLMTAQNGFQSGIAKSAPSIEVSNVIFNGGSIVKKTVDILEAWGCSFDKCRFVGGQLFSLSIVDCNNFHVTDCVSERTLFLSNADYNLTGTEAIGNNDLPALYQIDCNFGMNDSNKVYYGAVNGKSKYNYNITDVDNTGLFTTNAETTYLHEWELSGAANGTFSYDSDTNFLEATVNNGLMYILVDTAFLVRLTPGVQYNLTVDALMTNASVATSRGVTFSCGNVGQIYGSATLVKGVVNSVNISFIYNPPNPETAIVKIIIPAVNGISGVDYFEFDNLQITQASNEASNKLPMVFTIPETAHEDFRDTYGLANAYYIKWESITSFRVAESYKKYEDEVWLAPPVDVTGITGVSIHVPFAVAALVGENQACNTYTNNKFEDIEDVGILLRGAYGNVFAGNTNMKGNVSATPIGFSLEGGATENIIDGGYLGNRSAVTNMDKLWIGIKIDKYSYKNRIGTLALTDCKYLDIEDNYVGTSDLQNIYEESTFNNCFAYRVRATDYSVPNIGHRVISGELSSITSSTPIITDTEFTLLFKNVVFEANAGISVLFQQTDGTAQAGRVKIQRGTDKTLLITIGAVTVYTSAYSLENDFAYDIAVLRDSANVWWVYVNGVVSTNLTALQALVAPATGGTTKSYIGGDVASAESFTIGAFKYFNDTLSDAEVKTLYSNTYLSKNSKDVTVLTDTTANYAGAIGTLDGLTIPNHTSAGYTGTNALKVSLAVAPHFLTFNPADKLARSLRVSYYGKSSNVKGLMIYRGDIGRFLTMDTTYEKKTVYLRPDMRQSLKSSENMTFVFGKEEQFTFGSSFSIFSAGDVYLDRLRVWNGLAPVVVDLDFSFSIDGSYFNKASMTSFPEWTFPTSDFAPLVSPTFTGTVVLPSTTSIGNVSAAELAFIDGVTSAIQTQLNAKGTGTVTTVTSVAGNGISITIANPTTTPQLTMVATDLTPTTVNASGQITTGGNVRPSSSDSVSIGSTTLQYITVYSNNFLSKSGSAVNIGTAGANSFFFVSNGTQVGKVDPSTHNWIIQDGGTYTDDTKAIFQINSTTKGFKLPRMTTTQRDAITSPTEGLEIYNLTTHTKNFYNGTVWKAVLTD